MHNPNEIETPDKLIALQSCSSPKSEKELEIERQVEADIRAGKANNRFEFKLFDRHDPESDIGIYAISKRVRAFSKAVNRAMRVVKWFNEYMSTPEAKQVDAWSLSDCQITEKPSQFFIVHKEMHREYGIFFGKQTQAHNKENFYFPKQAIFNAQIIESPEEIEATVPRRVVTKDPTAKGGVRVDIVRELKKTPNKMFVPESCSSFPYKKEKNVERYFRIKVRYQIKSWYGFRTITEWVYGLKGHIFQHEIQHAIGRNIYYGRLIRAKVRIEDIKHEKN